MQAQLLTSEIPADVAGWWASEKYDGIRAIWTGSRLITRHGRKINAPEWFIRDLPRYIRLDGELWMGRGTFDALRSNMQRKGSDWSGIRFMVFDLAEIGTFEDRNNELCNIKLPAHCERVIHIPLDDNEELDLLERSVADCGGEGIVIRRPGSEYRPGRSGDVIKIKRITPDVDRWQG
jgi:DNA ligase-1